MIKTTPYTTKAQLVSALRTQLTKNSDRAIKALMTLFDYQTQDEQVEGKTKHSNGVGFMQRDDRILTSLALFYRDRGFLTQAQINILISRISKYAGQLVNHSIAKGMIKKDGRSYVFVV